MPHPFLPRSRTATVPDPRLIAGGPVTSGLVNSLFMARPVTTAVIACGSGGAATGHRCDHRAYGSTA